MLERIFRRVRGVKTRGAERAARITRWAVRPDGWKKAVGYENGILVESSGKQLFVAGQIAWTADQELVGPGDMAAQFLQALDNVLVGVAEAGGRPEELVRMTVFVTATHPYLAAAPDIGSGWRECRGRT